MGIRKYSLPGGDGDGSKVVYPLSLGMEMGMNFYYGDGDEIMIAVPAPPVAIPISDAQPHISYVINEIDSYHRSLIIILI